MKINRTQFEIKPSPPFHFKHTVYSHGWVVLAPNSWNEEEETLRRVQRIGAGKVVLLDIGNGGTAANPIITVDVSHPRKLTVKDESEIRANVERMFRVDEDLSEFYALCMKRGKRWHKLTDGLGRLLRSPSVFEDVVKTMATINMQWGGTKGMIRRLVDALGEPYPGDPQHKSFPTPEAVAEASPDVFKNVIRMGFRNDYVHTLAKRAASGELNLQALLTSDLPTKELKKELQQIKGIGNYAAANLLMLLGRYDELAIDSVCRNFAAKKYFKGRTPTDEEILKVYDRWGKWKFLAYWFDIWEGFHGEL